MNRRLRGQCLAWCLLVAATGAGSVLTITDLIPRAIFLAWALLGAGSAGFLIGTSPLPSERGLPGPPGPVGPKGDPGPPCAGPCCAPRPPTLGDAWRESMQPPRSTTEKG